MGTMTTSDLRQRNKESTLKYIYEQKRTQQQLICEALHISRPTVIPILRECEEEGLIAKEGFFESTGGRKANAIVFAANSKLSLGVELLIDSYEISALNLYGEILYNAKYDMPFSNSDTYFHAVCKSILLFIKEHSIPSDKILGIGIVLQGLISSDGTCVTYGKILNCTGLCIQAFTRYLPYPCKFFHDAEAAALDELWQAPQLQNAIYMNIRSHVSGAIITNRDFLKGTELKSGVFEHLTLIPKGRDCYCGRKGCVDTYCSTQALLDAGGSLQAFFRHLRSGDETYQNLWMEYLHYLATAINNLRMFIDYPIILGGTIAPYLQEEDIRLLHELVSEKTAFPTETEFIRTSQCSHSTISCGAALSYINSYLNAIMGL